MTPSSVILGIGGLLGHDANAALIVDGLLAASSQEERFTRVKHDGAFPRLAIADCLAIAELPPDAVTDVVFGCPEPQPGSTSHADVSSIARNIRCQVIDLLTPIRCSA